MVWFGNNVIKPNSWLTPCKGWLTFTSAIIMSKFTIFETLVLQILLSKKGPLQMVVRDSRVRDSRRSLKLGNDYD